MIMKSPAVSVHLGNRKGAMLAFVAIVMVALMGMLAMTLSVGAGDRQRRIAQTAADAGAIGGGTQIYRQIYKGMDSVAVVTAARNAAMSNGFLSGEIIVNYPPRNGPHAADTEYVEVFINKKIPTIFGSGSILRTDSMAIQARAVAGLGSPSNFCLVALGTSGNAIDIPGRVSAPGCGVVSNAGISVKQQLDASFVEAVGAIFPPPAAGVPSATGIPPIPDPLANLPMPSGADTVCTHTGMLTITKDTALTKGVYCGGITIQTNITATFGPGTYFIRGGGLSGGEVSALSGVTIINGIGPNGNVAAFQPITFGNSCLLNITAPTTGVYRGIAIFGDPAAGNAVNTVCGVGDITGTVYLPTQTFELQNSNSKLIINGTLIASDITAQNGGARFDFTVNNSGTNAPKRLSLVE